jgi:oxygen-independent coproporphyrinogen-3 oxidase
MEQQNRMIEGHRTVGESTIAASWPACTRTPTAAYLHVPFCRARCGYCNFSVIAGRDDLKSAYLSALAIELSAIEQVRPMKTIFIGGGTPTHLGVQWMHEFLALVGRFLPLEPGGEYSVEANPRDIDGAILDTFNAHGVNRVSLGVQSFSPDKLRLLERDHTPEVAHRAIERAATAIGRVSVDLIFAVPGETTEDWRSDLQTAASLPVEHVSTYGLTFEKGAAFFGRWQRGDLERLAEDDELALYNLAREHFASIGWEHYEVSNFSRPGAACRHNVAYWQGLGWLAFGPGAARYIDGVREVNHRSPTTYIQRVLAGHSPIAEQERLSPHAACREQLAFGLRMLEGVDLRRLADEFGDERLNAFRPATDRLCELGMIEQAADRLRLTSRGLPISDSVLAEFLSVPEPPARR